MKATIKKSSVLLLFFFFLTDNCWWLVNARMRSLAVELCWIIILIIFFIMLARRNCGELFNKNKYYYGKNILFYIVMGIYSSVQANLLYGQSLSEGLIPQRDIMCGFLFYFVIMNYIHMKDSGLHQIKHIFLIVGYIELILYISQYVLINDFSFLQVNYSYRLGDVRLNLNAMVIPYVIFSSVNNVYKNEKWKIKDFLAIAGGLFYVFQITKTRIALVAYFIAIVGGYVLWKKGGKKKAVVWIGLLILGFYIIQTPLFSFLMEGINNGDPSAQARELGRSVYISKILEI